MLRPRHAEDRRRAVILMVVLVLLTLFAIVGITFVFYAQKNHSASVNFREALQRNPYAGGPGSPPDIAPYILFRWAVGQLIYDVADDATGTQSALRGHSLARTMYGYNDQVLNLQPYNGTGRLHYTQPATAGVFAGADDYPLVNYTYFKTSDNILRDPERFGPRADLATARGPYAGGANASYTYPDLNTLALSAYRADGRQMMPSFHRPWLFNPNLALNDTTNANWTNAQGKYLILRPRPADHLLAGETGVQQDATGQWVAIPTNRPVFPYPADATGDIKNRIGSPGGNDSIWIDLGYPVTIAADGTKFKPLFAWTVEDLDGKINVNAAGNLMGYNAGVTDPATGNPPPSWHSSNRGLGKWEISLAQLLNAQRDPTEWRKLFLGTNTTVPATNGRYGPDSQPTKNGSSAPSIYAPRFFAPVDLNGADETQPNPTPTGPFTLPGTLFPFPTFPKGYDNGSAAALLNHARLYDYFQPGGPVPPGTANIYDDTTLPVSDMRRLMYSGATGSDAMFSVVATLCPQNFTTTALSGPALSPAEVSANLRRRQMVTTLSMDMNRLGMAPWLYDRSASQYVPPGANLDGIPGGPATAFPDLALRTAQTGTVPTNSDFRTPGQPNYVIDPTTMQPVLNPVVDWRSVDSALEKVNLDQALPRYPHQAGMLNGYHGRYDNPNAIAMGYNQTDVQNQYNLAQQARQKLAEDIYRRLLVVTGAAPPALANLAAPTDTELAPLRWLAQLAVNIVDYIDEDEISTPFNFYAVAYNYFATQAGLPATQLPATAAKTNTPNPNANGETVPKYWVFGTELPPVTLNEALVEYQEPLDNMGNKTDGAFFVQVWTELFTPFPTATPPGAQAQDSQQIPLYHDIVGGNAGTDYSDYKVAIANTDPGAYGPLMNISGNVTGTPSTLRSDGVFTTLNTRTVDPTLNPVRTAVDPQTGGYLLMGADSNTRDNSISPNNPDNVPGATPWVQTASMKYKVTRTNGSWDIDDRPAGVTLLLRRLANPHLPPDPNPTATDSTGNVIVNPVYNPYLTVDYLEKVPLNDATTPTPKYASRGKLQPYASDLATQVGDQVAGGNTKHTFGQPNKSTTPPTPAKADWLLHLDRTPVSPMELLYVSGFRPHELTHKFITSAGPQQHRVPWFDDDLPVPMSGQRTASHRLWRLFAFLETSDRAARISPRGRTPGKLNINTIWEFEVFQALCDASASNSFTAADVQTMWDNLLKSRTPGIRTPTSPNGPLDGTTIGANDRPFLELAGVGHLPATDVQTTPPGGGTPIGRGLEDTLFRLQDPTAAVNTPRLFEVRNATTAAHPSLQYDMLTKVYNNLTTRSNTFGVWLTVGFFQVTDDTTVPVKLGAEIGASTATNIRHRFFSIVDRTQLVLAPRLTSSVSSQFGQPPNPNGQVTVAELNQPKTISVVSKTLPTDPTNGLNGTITYSGSGTVAWAIQVGSLVVVDRGTPQEETVVVTKVDTANNTFDTTYQRPHAQGFAISIPGNPGPQPQFDPLSAAYAPVVPYWEILQ